MAIDKCDRCGCVGSDRRTLWMACFYAMSEMNVPFEEVAIETGTNGVKQSRFYYTLRVCKRCRADWMHAIQQWFDAKPQDEDDDAISSDKPATAGTGVFVRELGVNRELTAAEVKQRWPDYELD